MFTVCGEDNVTYSSFCIAECHHTLVRCTGSCPCLNDGCISDDSWNPVCGNDGITYLNAERVSILNLNSILSWFDNLKAKCNKHFGTETNVKPECDRACPCLTELADNPERAPIIPPG